MTSLSVVLLKIDPSISIRRRSSTAFTRFPLWATAIFPILQSTRSGWMLTMLESPIVEYRLWPIAMRPGSFARISRS